MELEIKSEDNKETIFAKIQTELEKDGFKIVNMDKSRPWGGFFVIDESQSARFIDHFLTNIPQAQKQEGKISPKILVVAPEKRLSWQYHHRRSEVWKVIHGEVGVVQSDTDEETPLQKKRKGDVIILKTGERHRLVGTDNWGVLAEIWQHTNPQEPSNEDDIVRVQDDFGR